MSLSKTSLGMGHVVSQALAKRGIQLHAVNNTPLQVLTDLSSQQLKLEASITGPLGNFEREDVVVAVESDANTPHPGAEVSQHDVHMSEAVGMLSRVLTNIHDLTQNTVNPMIDRCVKAAGEAIDAAALAGVSPLELVLQRPDAIFESVYLQESVSRYANQPRDFGLRGFPSIARPDPVSLLQTGHAGMDEQLAEFLGRVGHDFALSVWEQLFVSPPPSTLEVFGRPSQAREAVLAYFYAAKVLNDIPDGLDVDLSEWRSHVSGILAAAGASIYAGYAGRENQRRFGPLVLVCPQEAHPIGKIVVDGDKYADYTAAGGCPELIFAEAYRTKNFDVRHLLGNVEELKDHWAKVLAMYQSNIAIKRFDAMVIGVRQQLAREINTLAEDQLPPGVDRAVLHERLRERLTHAKLRDLDDLWHFARKAVCRVLFYHTEVEALLLAIEDEGKRNPDVPVRELALMATVEIVARWLVDQMTYEAHSLT